MMDRHTAGHKDKLLLLELQTLELLRNFALYTWHSRVHFTHGIVRFVCLCNFYSVHDNDLILAAM